jgi:hypothetical protein
MFSNFYKKLISSLIVLVSIVGFLQFSPVMAAPADPGVGKDIGDQLHAAGMGTGIKEPVDPRVTVMLIIRTLLRLIGIVVLCLMLYAGFLWMTAGGNDTQVEHAQSLLRNAVIGLAVILASYSITIFVIYLALGRTGSFWDRIFGSV